jgi:hypothetical protein
MTFHQKVRDVFNNSGRQIRNVFRSKAEIQDKKDSLFQIIKKGQLAEGIVNSAGWTELLEPSFDRIRNKARFDLENDHSPYQRDEGRYYPRGVIHAINEIKKVLKKAIEQAQVARQELGLLQKEEERQDNV